MKLVFFFLSKFALETKNEICPLKLVILVNQLVIQRECAHLRLCKREAERAYEMQQQAPAMAATPTPTPNASAQANSADAPPKQVAQAMERLSHAARLIADIRLGADRLLEALFAAAQPNQSNRPIPLFQNEDASMRQHLQDLRSIGKTKEKSKSSIFV